MELHLPNALGGYHQAVPHQTVTRHITASTKFSRLNFMEPLNMIGIHRKIISVPKSILSNSEKMLTSSNIRNKILRIDIFIVPRCSAFLILCFVT